jgi:UDP-N-acetylmuramate: L-alanyl-gamma-D-glutamyl-meso-diaminopimelate ligase
VFVFAARDLGFDPKAALAPLGARLTMATEVPALLERLLAELTSGDQVVLMSNGGFGGLPELLQKALEARASAT